MATMIIGDHILWARQIEGDPDLARAIRALPADGSLTLRIEGKAMRFHRARDGATGEPMDGVEPDADDAASWRLLRARCGSTITVEPVAPSADPYLLSLSATLTEWNSPEDAAAYDGL